MVFVDVLVLRLLFLQLSQIMFFYTGKDSIENHGDDAQENDRQDHPVKFEDLTAVDNEKSKSLPGSNEFTDDHTNQTEPDIDFHGADDRRNTGSCSFFSYT